MSCEGDGDFSDLASTNAIGHRATRLVHQSC
jgi:hypothetical protein